MGTFDHRGDEWRLLSGYSQRRMAETFQVELEGGERITALNYRPSDSGTPPSTLILAHGAGANQSSSFMVRTAAGLSARGLQAFTFNVTYSQQQPRSPDLTPKIEAYCQAVT